jgi:prolyl oligopeptidase
MRLAILALILGLAKLAAAAPNMEPDTNLWLEDILGQKSLQWVQRQNSATAAKLEAAPGFIPLQQRLLSILNSDERIPFAAKHGKYYYNFWRDARHVRGLWRRTSWEEYTNSSAAWETVLDLDNLAQKEKENWVWHGYEILQPDYDRCLIRLSHGGTDADVIREFDLTQKNFVTNGFVLPEAKSDVQWLNRDTLYVGTDFGHGSLTSSGYPRIIKEWRRGTPLTSARTVFEGEPQDVEVDVSVDHDHGRVYEFIQRGKSFFADETFLRRGGVWVRIDKPDDAIVSTFENFILFRLRSDWTVGGRAWKSGSLLAADLHGYLAGKRELSAVFEPSARISLSSFTATKDYLILTELDNVRSRPWLVQYKDGNWNRSRLDAPEFGTVSIDAIDEENSDDYFMRVTDFLTPSSLWFGTAGAQKSEKLKSLPAFFNSDNLEIRQFEAKSKDGTLIPYFQVGRKDLPLDGKNVTLLNGYGGFEIPMLPGYNPTIGAAWLERGGVFVLANIRGGGEFGPGWHNAARKEHRQRAYDDFIAVAEDLIARKVTSPLHLGIEGRSNGGLLMGVMLTERPDLFGAIHCGSPLLDMRRFNKLLAGASWMDEYGNPDKPQDWAYIQKYSPYQNTHADQKYPPILITTSTRDDRVHPGHARKMAARLEAEGHNVLYYENIEGGHGAAANNTQIAFMDALAFTFLWQELSKP